MLGVGPDLAHRHLVRAPGALDRLAVDLLRAGPALGRPQHDHRPARPLGRAALARRPLDRGDLLDDGVHDGRPSAGGRRRVVALDEVRRVPVALHQRPQLVLRDPGQDRRVGDLVAVEVQDRQHGAVADRVEELVRVPAGGQRARSRPRRRRRRARRRGPGCRTPRRRRARARSRARRPRGSSPASPARRGWGSRRGRRTGGRAAASRPRRG